jgi:predicted nucleic acid-binding protein
VKLRYLDANVFVFAALDEGSRGDKARELLRSIATEDDRAATSSLTIDEVVWVLQGEGPREVAVREGQRLLAFPNLEVFDVAATDVFDSLAMMEDHERLDPRDAIHASVALNHGVHTVVSDDPDLEAVPDVERRPLV